MECLQNFQHCYGLFLDFFFSEKLEQCSVLRYLVGFSGCLLGFYLKNYEIHLCCFLIILSKQAFGLHFSRELRHDAQKKKGRETVNYNGASGLPTVAKTAL